MRRDRHLVRLVLDRKEEKSPRWSELETCQSVEVRQSGLNSQFYLYNLISQMCFKGLHSLYREKKEKKGINFRQKKQEEGGRIPDPGWTFIVDKTKVYHNNYYILDTFRSRCNKFSYINSRYTHKHLNLLPFCLYLRVDIRETN